MKINNLHTSQKREKERKKERKTTITNTSFPRIKNILPNQPPISIHSSYNRIPLTQFPTYTKSKKENEIHQLL